MQDNNEPNQELSTDKLMELGHKLFNSEALLEVGEAFGLNRLEILSLVTGIVRSPEPVSGTHPGFNWTLHLVKQKAVEDGVSWAAMARAMGEGDDRAAANRVQRRYEHNEQLLREHRARHVEDNQ